MFARERERERERERAGGGGELDKPSDKQRVTEGKRETGHREIKTDREREPERE